MACRRSAILRKALKDAFTSEVPTQLKIDVEQEVDGRWVAEIEAIPGVLAYGVAKTDAVAKVQALALQVLAERLDNGEEAALPSIT